VINLDQPAKGTRRAPATAGRDKNLNRLERLEVLYRISNLINRTQDPGRVLREVLKEVVRFTGATSGSIAMLDARRGVLQIETAFNIPTRKWKHLKLELGVGVTGWAAYKGEPVRVADVRRDAHYIAIKPDIRSELAVPMFLHGKVIGVINVDSTRVGAFGEEDEKLLVALADQAARVVETARLYRKMARHAEQMRSLFDVGRELTSPAPLSRVLSLVVREGRRLFEAEACLLAECHPETDEMRVLAADSAESGWEDAPPIKARDSVVGPVIRKGRALAIESLRERRPFWSGHLGEVQPVRSLLAVPVIAQDVVQAVLVVLFTEERPFSATEKQLLELLGNQASVALEDARSEERIAAMETSMHRVERISLLGTLAAEIAHEIRNPVTIINLLLHSVQEETRENPQVCTDLAIVREKLERIERIVDQTLNMARNKDPELERLDINELIRDVLLFMNYKFAKAGIEVKASLSASIPPLMLDRGQVQQVLLNLIMNALEAMQPGGRLTIRTTVCEEDGLGTCLQVSVADTGRGIAREHLPHLFDPFYTTRSNGTGLGLFVSNKLVASHGGELRVRTRENKGTTFTVLLPLGASAPAQG
jgi:signal transduction histidine kinase